MYWVHVVGNKDIPKLDNFLSDIQKVCVNHGISISHEDAHGSFVFETFDENRFEWLSSGSVELKLFEELNK